MLQETGLENFTPQEDVPPPGEELEGAKAPYPDDTPCVGGRYGHLPPLRIHM